MRSFLSLSLLTLAVSFGLGLPSYAQPANPNRFGNFSERAKRPQLNLSDAQKQQMRALREKTRQQIQAVLTPAQRSQLESALQSGQSRREVMRSLNLSDAQKQQMRAIREESRKQRMAILTPEQRTQLEQMRRDRPATPWVNPQ